jgi:iron-sulfur cluster assembly protein
MNIQITAAANEYIKKMLEKDASVGFRLTVKKTGCSGYSYAPSLVTEINPKDMALEKDGIKLFIDIAWLDLLQDVQIDYVEDAKTGIKQKRLIFTNPKEDSRCGCGESFHI